MGAVFFLPALIYISFGNLSSLVKKMEIEQLREMKRHMAIRGNWKEVKRINKMMEFARMPPVGIGNLL